MTSRNDKTKQHPTLIAFAISLFALLIVSTSGAMAADKMGQKMSQKMGQKMSQSEEVAAATVKSVDADNGMITLEVDKNWKISGIDQGDEIEIVVGEETDEMKQQKPRKWRMFRHPYGGPSDK